MNNNKTSETDNYTWQASAESKGQAKSLRLFAILAWVVAIGLEIWAIIMLKTPPISMAWLIGLIVVDLGFAILGSVLWKKSNRLDPASEKDKTRFFIQNQLGVIISVIAFLPLVVLIFTNKDLNGKQKGILGSVAVVAMLIASIVGIDFNPASIEQYTKQTQEVEVLMGTNKVFWTESGSSYHLFHDCSYINSDRTKAIFDGTVAKARELKNITDICDRCKHRVEKEKELDKFKTINKSF
jgi:dipeptide/tripeptide permease